MLRIDPNDLSDLVAFLNKNRVEEKLVAEFQRRCEALNQLIGDYNQPDNTPSLEKLESIKSQINALIDILPHEMIIKSKTLQSIFHDQLIVALQQEYNRMPRDQISLEERIINQINQLSLEEAQTCATYLSNGQIPPLLSGNPDYSIKYLGGSNSRNFLVEPTDQSAQRFVLKLEYRFHKTREEEARFRAIEPLKKVFTPTRQIRQITHSKFNHRKQMAQIVVSEFMTTTYCAKGSPIEVSGYMKKTTQLNKDKAITERINAACHIYEQMAKVFYDLDRHSVAFPDAKNTNWLIDHQDRIRIADTKSLMGMNETVFSSSDLIRSPHMIPPECATEWKNAKPAAVHAYLLGKNLYQFLTGLSDAQLELLPSQSYFSFTGELFASPQGLELQLLILQLTMDDPAMRIGTDDAAQEISRIFRERPHQAPYVTKLEINKLMNARKEKQDLLINEYRSEYKQLMADRTFTQYAILLTNIEPFKKIHSLFTTSINAQKTSYLLSPEDLIALKKAIESLKIYRSQLDIYIRKACLANLAGLKLSYARFGIDTTTLSLANLKTPFMKLVLEINELKRAVNNKDYPITPQIIEQIERLEIIRELSQGYPAMDQRSQQIQAFLVYFEDLKKDPKFTQYAEENIKKISYFEANYLSHYQLIDNYYATTLIPRLSQQIHTIKEGNELGIQELLTTSNNNQWVRDKMQIAQELIQDLKQDKYNPAHYQTLSDISSLLDEQQEIVSTSHAYIYKIEHNVNGLHKEYSDYYQPLQTKNRFTQLEHASTEIKRLCELGINAFKDSWIQALNSIIVKLQESECSSTNDPTETINHLKATILTIEQNEILIFRKDVQATIQQQIDEASSHLNPKEPNRQLSFFTPHDETTLQTRDIDAPKQTTESSVFKKRIRVIVKAREVADQEDAEPSNKEENHAKKI